MTQVNSVQAAPSAGLTAASGLSSTLGKDDFLRLLVAQLQNQDPLNPSDPTEFTAQLAQFSSLEQLFGINDSLQQFSQSQGDMERLAALGMIGKDVVAQTSSFAYAQAPLQLGYRLDHPADAVRLLIQDDQGRTRAVLDSPAIAAGQHFVSWDGIGSNGAPLPAGSYRLVVEANSLQGEAMSAAPLVKGRVSGVELGADGSQLVSSAGPIRMQDVLSVRGGQG